jgi:hypothetical protein
VAAGIAEKITLDGFEKALESKRQSILRRLREYEDIAVSAPTARRRTSARRYVRTLERQLDKLSLWRNAENLAERERVLAQLRESVQNNLKLRDLLHHGGGPMLMESAADLAFGQSLRGPASLAKTPLKTVVADFMDYFSNRISHFRGNSGEWDLAYDLGKKGHVVLKCGDEFVSRRGTDLVTMFREADGRWRMMIFDNKAIRDATVTEVSALVDNLLTNLKSDQKLFAAMARRPGAQPEFAEAARRLQVVTAEIDLIMKSHGGKMTHLAQSEIAFALAKQDVQLIVSNAGGQAKGLSQSLRTMMDFYPSPGGVLPTAIPVPTTVP